MKTIGRKAVSIGILLLLLCLSLIGCAKSTNNTGSSNADDAGKIVVQFGYQPGCGQAIVANAEGFFQQALGSDVKVELVKFQSGPPLITAITADQLDFGLVGDQPAIQAKANNVDIKIIGKYLSSDKVNGLIVRKDSSIKSIADLKGKKVGVTIGSTGQQLLYILLKSAGLKPSDIQQINLQPGDIVSSITFRNIDAAVTWEPYISLTTTQGTTTELTDATGYKNQVSVIIGRNEFLKKYPEIAVGILKAQNEAGQWIKEHPEEARQLIAKDAGIDKSVINSIVNKVNMFDVTLTQEDIDSIDQSIKFSVEYKLIPKEFSVNDFIDTQYLRIAGLE